MVPQWFLAFGPNSSKPLWRPLKIGVSKLVLSMKAQDKLHVLANVGVILTLRRFFKLTRLSTVCGLEAP